jgi:anti-anti-sigma factor
MLGVMSENCGNAAILRCSGRIVAGEEAWSLYNAAIAQQDKRAIVLDLTAVSRMDAGGLGVLVSLRQWAHLAGVKLQLIPSKAVQELLDVARLSSLFEIRSTDSMPLTAADLRNRHADDTFEGQCA